MVCGKCEKKLAKVCSFSSHLGPQKRLVPYQMMHATWQNAPSAPDPWKAGANNSTSGRKIGENKLLSKKDRYAILVTNHTHGMDGRMGAFQPHS